MQWRKLYSVTIHWKEGGGVCSVLEKASSNRPQDMTTRGLPNTMFLHLVIHERLYVRNACVPKPVVAVAKVIEVPWVLSPPVPQISKGWGILVC